MSEEQVSLPVVTCHYLLFEVAKRVFGSLSVWHFLQGVAIRSGYTVEEVAAQGKTAAARKRYVDAIAEWRDKKSVREAARLRSERKKHPAEREDRAAKLRKRPVFVDKARTTAFSGTAT